MVPLRVRLPSVGQVQTRTGGGYSNPVDDVNAPVRSAPCRPRQNLRTPLAAE